MMRTAQSPEPAETPWQLMVDVADLKQSFTVLVTWLALHNGQVAGLAAIGPEQGMRALGAALVRRRAELVFHPKETLPYPLPDWFAAVKGGARWEKGQYAPLHVIETHWRFTYTRVSDKSVQLIAIPASAYDPASAAQPMVVMSPPGVDPDDAVWARLQQEALPLLSEWRPALLEALKSAEFSMKLRAIQTIAAPGQPDPALWHIDGFTERAWEGIIQELLRTGRISMQDGIGPNGPLPTDRMTQDEYLAGWAPALGAKLESVVVPRVKAGTGAPASWSVLKRQPMPAQADVIRATAETCLALGRMYLVGETGTGKTLMGATAIWHLMTELKGRTGFRAVIMAPDHLIAKWQREIEATIPGAVVRRINSWKDVLALRDERHKPATQPTYFLLGRDRSKLSYYVRPAATWESSRYGGTWRCPDCGRVLIDPKTDLLFEKSAFARPRVKNRWCPHCHGTPDHPPTVQRRPANGQGLLWMADGKRLHRMSPARLIHRYLKGFFDAFMADELHELKGESAQGDALGAIASVVPYVIGGTGTLNGGYASNQHFLGFRLHPWTMVADGLTYHQPSSTTRRYGRLETETPVDDGDAGVLSHRSVSRERTKELPGVSPEFFARHLAERAVFIELADLGADALPPYEETIDWIQPTPEQGEAIKATMGPLAAAALDALHNGRRHLLGKLVNFSLSYPDTPWSEPICDPVTGEEVVVPPCLPEDAVYPKDERLLQHIRAAVNQRHEKVWVYTVFTGTQLARLKMLIRNAGFRVAVMTTAIDRTEREAWVAERLKDGVDVVLSHPKLVETGVDLFEFPTILWFATGYSLFQLRQASRRAWRLGQTRACRVVYLVYEGTMQEAALTLMGRKMEAALALEGRLSLAGLQALGASDSSNDLARVLAEGLPEGTDASAIWQATPQEMIRIVPVNPLGDQEGMASQDDILDLTGPLRSSSVPVLLVAARSRRRHGQPQPPSDDAGQLAWGF